MFNQVKIIPLIVLLFLNACYCDFDGDEQSQGTLDYFEGCFKKAKHG